MAGPQKVIITCALTGSGHNPPYLIPLVEVAGGELTDQAAVDWLAEFYAGAGKRPLRLTRELPGFVANRLQEAYWREALHMIAPERLLWRRSTPQSPTGQACAGR